MKCCHCGKRIPDAKEICPYCGHLQLEVEVKDANRRRTMRVLLTVLLFAALAAGIFFFLQYRPAKTATPVPTVDPLAGYLVNVTPRPAATSAPVETETPSAEPTAEATAEPTAEPTAEATAEPTAESTPEPTPEPTEEPAPVPTAEPAPEVTAEPTAAPTPVPTPVPTERPRPGVHDIKSMRLPFVAPKSDSWLSDYEIVYVKPDHEGRAVYLLNSPSNFNFICGVVYVDLPQTALARENGHTLIRTDDGRLGWVKTYLLTEGTLLYPEAPAPAETANTEPAPASSATVQPTVNEPTVTLAPAVQSTAPIAVTEAPSIQNTTQSANNAIANVVNNALSSISDATTTTYVADISSAIFHTTECSKVDEISDVYRWENTKSREELLRLGYEPCSVCKP